MPFGLIYPGREGEPVKKYAKNNTEQLIYLGLDTNKIQGGEALWGTETGEALHLHNEDYKNSWKNNPTPAGAVTFLVVESRFG